MNIEVTEGSSNVFADLGLSNPRDRQAKAIIAVRITQFIKKTGWKQAEAAEKIGLQQPDVSNIVYWTKQWNLVDPHVEPLRFATDANGRIVIDVHQVVRDLQGHLLEDLTVQHIYRMEMEEDRRMAIGVD